MDEWLPVRFFEGYSVSTSGFVRRDETGRRLTVLVNQFGMPHVGMMRNKILHKRAITPLVAQAFISSHDRAFDTPINLDGDRMNNRITNILWRPRWFAVKYYQQFRHGIHGITSPIEEITTGEQFANSWDAAIKYGLLDHEIMMAILARTYVWPTYQRFRVVA